MESIRVPLGTGLTYHVLQWGDEAAELEHTVVLLHGFLDFAWSWEEVVQSGLEGRYHIIAPDLRGHGDSDRIGSGGYYHFMDYLADVHELIEKLGRKRVSIVGHSMGGSVAAYYVGSYPEKISRLAILEGLGPPAQGLETMPDRVRSWLMAWRRVVNQPQRPLASVEDAAERLRRHDPRLNPELALRLAERGTRLLPDGRRVFKHDPLHLTPGPYPFVLEIAQAFWKRISCPVLLVAAEDSDFKYNDADLELRRQSFIDAREVKLAGAGHMMQRHQPAALARLLIDFLG